jgi:hypothetical protein
MSGSLTVEVGLHVEREQRGRKAIRPGEAPARPALPPGRVPRVARLLALAHHFEGLLRRGLVKDYAGLARLGRVTRARVTQVMNLLLLAPDVQEAILFLPLTTRGRDPLRLGMLQPIALTPCWAAQRRLWAALNARVNVSDSR